MALFNFLKQKQNRTTNLAGGQAYAQTPQMQLVSILLTSFAQDQFYRSAQGTFADIIKLLPQVDPKFAAKAAVFARNEYGMRSITHVLAAELAAHASGQVWSKNFYDRIVRRPDDMLEIAAYYFGNGGKTLPNAMKKGFASAFARFDGYQLAKYRGEQKAVKLVDLVNLVRPVPNERNALALKQLVAGELKSHATWEAKLTQAGQVAETEEEKAELKSAAWAELLRANKLGYLALLRNLRNIAEQAPELAQEVAAQLTDRRRIKQSLVLPFQYLSALDAIQDAQVGQKRLILNALNTALELALDNVPRFAGRTLVVLDDSGSMTSTRTKYANRTPIQIGSLFAAALFKANDADLMRFSDEASYVRENPADSMAGIAERLVKNARSAGTNFHAIFQKAKEKYDRIVILSDMQGWMHGGAPTAPFAGYRRKYDATPYVYSFDLQGYGSLQFPEQNVFALAGFSEKVFDLMQLLETDRLALIREIEKVELN
jgi:hypothetical protein